MRSISIVLVIALLVVNALAMLPAAAAFYLYLLGASLALAVLLLVSILVTSGRRAEPGGVKDELEKPIPAAGINQAEAEVIGFLAMLQEKGRLVDFIMDDITAYNDAQVGAAARVVHQGCRAVMQDHFSIRPVRAESEGSIVKVAPGYVADEYRLIGKIRGDAPFSGTLIHRGWRAESVNLPRVLRASPDRLPTIAPAEVELQ
ncbi:MAG: DUF2760 domain-containing protein [Verrucomicrobia bacterium]|nr:DUF2760 domain-containing protein [Verrucomicrobiota bacterium]